jgi:hypothetical protein
MTESLLAGAGEALNPNALGFLFSVAGDFIDKANVRCRNCQTPVWIVLDYKNGKRQVDPRCVECREPRCVICGCTDRMACVTKCIDGGYACSWMAPGVCSACFHALAEHAYLKATGRR